MFTNRSTKDAVEGDDDDEEEEEEEEEGGSFPTQGQQHHGRRHISGAVLRPPTPILSARTSPTFTGCTEEKRAGLIASPGRVRMVRQWAPRTEVVWAATAQV